MAEIILYTTHCPKCEILKAKLNEKNIEYKEIDNVELMKDMGMTVVPMLVVKGDLLEFKAAVDWVNQQ